MAAGIAVEDKREEFARGVRINGKLVTAEDDVLKALDDHRDFIESVDRKWKMDEALSALGIDAGWFFEPFVFDIIRRYLYYRKAPHNAFPGYVDEHPMIWVESSKVLDGVFGVSL